MTWKLSVIANSCCPCQWLSSEATTLLSTRRPFEGCPCRRKVGLIWIEVCKNWDDQFIHKCQQEKTRMSWCRKRHASNPGYKQDTKYFKITASFASLRFLFFVVFYHHLLLALMVMIIACAAAPENHGCETCLPKFLLDADATRLLFRSVKVMISKPMFWFSRWLTTQRNSYHVSCLTSQKD